MSARGLLAAALFAVGMPAAAAGVASGSPAAEPPARTPPSMQAFVGAWTIDLSRSRMGRAGPNGVQTQRSSRFTWVFTPEPGGLRMDIYAEYPAPSPTKTMHVVPDGRHHPCTMQESCLGTPGDPAEQAFAFWQPDEHLLIRNFRVRGADVEYNVYALSPDGRTFVATSWSPGTPEYQNEQVFVKQP